MKKHLKKCKMYTSKLEDYVEGNGDSKYNLIATWFTQENYRTMLASMDILDDCPLHL